MLMATGVPALAWWRLRSASADPKIEASLHDAFRLQTLDARLHERRLARAAALLQAAGADYVLAKGWAVARHYARPGLRPYGDLDLFVAPEHHERARRVLTEHDQETLHVDLHAGVPLLGRAWPEVRDGAEEVTVEGVRVPVLRAEHHLTLLCLHLLFHGAWRPTWLCDVAAFVETVPEEFDWDRVGGGSRRQLEQCRAVVVLSQTVLGADLGRTPWGGHAALPRWLPSAVRRAWGAGGHYSVTTRLGLTEPRPRELMEAVRVRWPNPIEASFRWRAPLNAFPRLPFQFMDVAARAGRLLLRR
jgi:Uncharacterised nucleotidyltransferase